MDHNIKLLILPPHSSHVTQPLDIGLFSPLKKYLSREITKLVGTNIACLAKPEWCTGYVNARTNAFTFHNIQSSWNGAGLYPFQPRKVIRRIRGLDTPPPTATPPPTDNIFETALLHSSPSDIVNMYEANKALQMALNSSSALDSSQKDYVRRLGQKAESYKARIIMLEKRIETAQGVLSARKKVETGVRQYFKGKHLLSAGDIYEKVASHEKIIEERKNKKQRKTTTQATEESQDQVEDASTGEV